MEEGGREHRRVIQPREQHEEDRSGVEERRSRTCSIRRVQRIASSNSRTSPSEPCHRRGNGARQGETQPNAKPDVGWAHARANQGRAGGAGGRQAAPPDRRSQNERAPQKQVRRHVQYRIYCYGRVRAKIPHSNPARNGRRRSDWHAICNWPSGTGSKTIPTNTTPAKASPSPQDASPVPTGNPDPRTTSPGAAGAADPRPRNQG
ncbi:hypothetical protein BJ875DRAFT_479499 [Amylocarpus encephaloides]|uniref:Uncharacterized protein n=1 Tax=Amylocarpus encephaloides TaxID=45428 RepID=A0A9P7YT75_9HELO|nr:hypothetical protein BJ875DRAFT_479499 [Amylocarpus encephaloides]